MLMKYNIDGVDGVLVGSASLEAESFASMINHK
jgi:triosephosphate isomerase